MSQIKDQEIRGRHTRTYLCYLNDRQGTLIDNMETVIKEIYHHQSHAFKINMSFSFILQHCETPEYRYFYASNNEQLLKSPRLRPPKPVKSLSCQRFPLSSERTKTEHEMGH